MKLTRLSLVAIAVVGLTSTSFAAETLVDAFKNGKITGELKAFYFDRDTGDNVASVGAGDASIFCHRSYVKLCNRLFDGIEIWNNVPVKQCTFCK